MVHPKTLPQKPTEIQSTDLTPEELLHQLVRAGSETPQDRLQMTPEAMQVVSQLLAVLTRLDGQVGENPLEPKK